MLGRAGLAGFILAILLGGCDARGPSPDPGGDPVSPAPDAIRVVTTTTVFADLVRQVGRERVAVDALVPQGGEVHTFDPSPADATRLADADLIVANGLGLDDWLLQLARSTDAEAPIVQLAVDLPGARYIGSEDADGDTGPNPHLWLNVGYARSYVGRLVGALAATDPDHAADIEQGGRTYDARLAELDTWARDRIAPIALDRRRIVSFHDAFPYLAEAYGIELVGVVVDAPGQDPSAGEIAALIRAIDAADVPAILAEAQFPDDLARTIAAETGATVVSDLHTDSLGDPPADSYEGLIRWDIERIARALE